MQYPDAISFHVRNEGIRGTKEQRKAYGAKYKRMGVLSGVSDIVILEPRGKFHGLLIELKAPKGRLTQTQKDFLNKAENKGYDVAVCWSFDEVMVKVDSYMNLNHI